nr:hypothetical protein [Tanacetum cinerariifolium]
MVTPSPATVDIILSDVGVDINSRASPKGHYLTKFKEKTPLQSLSVVVSAAGADAATCGFLQSRWHLRCALYHLKLHVGTVVVTLEMEALLLADLELFFNRPISTDISIGNPSV